MKQALMLVPTTVKINSNGDVTATWTQPFPSPEKAGEFGIAVAKTTRAITIGGTIAAMDGPIPILDVVGFGVATGMSIHAWYEYFS